MCPNIAHIQVNDCHPYASILQDFKTRKAILAECAHIDFLISYNSPNIYIICLSLKAQSLLVRMLAIYELILYNPWAQIYDKECWEHIDIIVKAIGIDRLLSSKVSHQQHFL
jgi:predicted metalloenzyme YecM